MDIKEHKDFHVSLKFKFSQHFQLVTSNHRSIGLGLVLGIGLVLAGTAAIQEDPLGSENSNLSWWQKFLGLGFYRRLAELFPNLAFFWGLTLGEFHEQYCRQFVDGVTGTARLMASSAILDLDHSDCNETDVRSALAKLRTVAHVRGVVFGRWEGGVVGAHAAADARCIQRLLLARQSVDLSLDDGDLEIEPEILETSTPPQSSPLSSAEWNFHRHVLRAKLLMSDGLLVEAASALAEAGRDGFNDASTIENHPVLSRLASEPQTSHSWHQLLQRIEQNQPLVQVSVPIPTTLHLHTCISLSRS